MKTDCPRTAGAAGIVTRLARLEGTGILRIGARKQELMKVE